MDKLGGSSQTALLVLTSINSSDFHSCEDQFLSAFHSWVTWWVSVQKSPCSLMPLIWFFPGLSDAVEASSSDWCRTNIPYSDVCSMLYACIVHDAVHSSRSYQDPYGFWPWDPQTWRILSVCCSNFDLQVSIPNWWWNINWLHIRHDKCIGRSRSESRHCLVMKNQ